MKDTGIVRQVDDLGRIVIPVEIRRRLQIEQGDPLQVWVRGDRIVLAKPVEQCVFCSHARDLDFFQGRAVCAVCRAELSARAPGSDRGDEQPEQEQRAGTSTLPSLAPLPPLD